MIVSRWLVVGGRWPVVVGQESVVIFLPLLCTEMFIKAYFLKFISSKNYIKLANRRWMMASYS